MSLTLWLVVLAFAVTWGARGWIYVVRYRQLLDDERLQYAAAQREHWRALGATYGAVQAAKAELQEANERLAELKVTRRVLLRYHEALAEYVEPETGIEADALLLNEGRVILETAGLLKPERREVVS